MTETFNWLIRTSTQAEAEMSRVERVMHYIQLQSEAPLFAASEPHGLAAGVRVDPVCRLSDEADAERMGLRAPHAAWPQSGCVQFTDVFMRYRVNLDPVLQGVTFVASPGEKVGIVGRTGAGKSSIMLALFRIVEIESGVRVHGSHLSVQSFDDRLRRSVSGSIQIDGVDVSKLGLRRLRSCISIIPQTPVLFSGTFRTNLNPDFDVVVPQDGSVRVSEVAECLV
jgi:ABC-type multidrug transport system fused ATPase/permease subunit